MVYANSVTRVGGACPGGSTTDGLHQNATQRLREYLPLSVGPAPAGARLMGYTRRLGKASGNICRSPSGQARRRATSPPANGSQPIVIPPGQARRKSIGVIPLRQVGQARRKSNRVIPLRQVRQARRKSIGVIPLRQVGQARRKSNRVIPLRQVRQALGNQTEL